MQKQHVVVRFCGDSGDGMQLTGTMFASLSAILGNEISTLPDFPAEIRAPQGTLGGVSGFQVIPIQTGQHCVFGSPPNSVEQEQNIFVFVESSQ